MKPYGKKTKIENVEIQETFFEIDAKGWRAPEYLAIGDLRQLLEIDSSIAISVTAHEFDTQATNPELPPNSRKITRLELAADDNFLYVWIGNRWKRIPLSEF